MNKNVLITLVTVMIIIIFFGCASAIRYDGPYEGKVIDADTGEPIESVVILGVWNREHITPGGAVSEYYDASETLTDKNGEFSIPGQGLLIASNVTPMHVLIFKSGYEEVGYMTWQEMKKIFNKKDDRAIIPLRKKTIDERIRLDTPIRPNIPIEKMKLMTKEINKERIMQDLKPF